MNRKEFIKRTCGIGACACILPSLLKGEIPINNKDNLTGREKFIQNRFTKLIDILDNNLDEETRNEIVEKLGRECSKQSNINQYKNNLSGFFDHIRKNWKETAIYNEERGVIRIETAERSCVCPMFDAKKVSKSICHCSVGWQAQTYETILGKKVEARCIESVIKGSNRCVFEVKVL